MVWAGPRIYWAMALDGVFPSFFKTVTPSTGVPRRAMYLQSGWTSLLIVTGTFEQLVIFSGFILSAFTALTIGAVIVLRRRYPDLIRPYLAPFYPVLPAIVILVLLIVIGTSVVQRPFESALGIAAILAGWPFYYVWNRTRL